MSARLPANGRRGRLYCRIAHWIEATSPGLAKALRETCLDVKLNPFRDAPGITFLYPADEEFRKEIEKAAEEDTEEASRLLGSLILVDFFGGPADFAAREAGTLGRTKYKVAVKGDAVELPGGATIRPAPGFAPSKDLEGRIAVWSMKGRPTFPTEPFAPRPRAREEGPPKPKKGGGAGVGARQRLAAAVEGAYVRALEARSADFHPYLAAVASILNLLKSDAKYAGLLEGLTPLLDFNPITCFYILVEPTHTDEENCLIPAEFFANPVFDDEVPRVYSNALTDFIGFFRPWSAEPGADDKAGIAHSRALMEARDGVRHSLHMSRSIGATQELLLQAYNDLVGRNRLGEAAGALPAPTLELLRRGAGSEGVGLRKLHQDEFRFRLRSLLLSVSCDGPPTGNAFRDKVLNFIYTEMPGRDYRGELCVLRGGAGAGAGAGVSAEADSGGKVHWMAQQNATLYLFYSATVLLYTAAPPAALGEAWAANMCVPDPMGQPFNYNRATKLDLDRCAGPRLVAGGGRMAHRDSISAGALAELRLYARTHEGRLPPEVAALSAPPGGDED